MIRRLIVFMRVPSEVIKQRSDELLLFLASHLGGNPLMASFVVAACVSLAYGSLKEFMQIR